MLGRRERPTRPPLHPATEIEAIVLDYIPRGYYADPHREHRTGPVAQALGLRSFRLLDGTPLEPVEPLEYVTLAREVVRSILVPGPGRPTMRRVSLACLPGKDKKIYCYPYNVDDPTILRLTVESVESEDPNVIVVTSLEALSSVAEDRGLPPKILVVPRTPITYNDLSDFARKTLEEAVRKVVEDRKEIFIEFFNIAEPINIRLHSLNLLKGIGRRTLLQLLRERSKKPFQSFDEIRKIIKSDPEEALVAKIMEELRGEARYYLFVPPNDPSALFLDYLDKARRSLARRRKRVE